MTFERKSTSGEGDFSTAIMADLMRLATLRASSTAFAKRDRNVTNNISINSIANISIIFRRIRESFI